MRCVHSSIGSIRETLIRAAAILLFAAHPLETSAAEVVGADDVRAVLESSPCADYRIYAVRVGTSPDARRGLFIADPSMPKRIEVAFAFWVLKSKERIILIDTGFVNQKMVKSWNVKGYRDPIDGLAELGIAPDQVTDIIVTHGHWDHIGGISRFSNARIWIHRKELNALKGRRGGRLPKAFRRAEKAGRLSITRAVEPAAPSVVVVPAGLHTPGFQYVVVQNRDGLWVIASDVAPLHANFERRKPTGQSDDPGRTLEVQETMLELVNGNLGRIIPGHEPRVFAARNIVELTASSKSADK